MDDTVKTTIRQLMANLPKEEELLLWVLVNHGGLTPPEVAEQLPLGMKRSTAYNVYNRVDPIVHKLVEAGIFPEDLIHG